MAVPIQKNTFAAGELSPSLWGRTDLAKYHAGVSTMRNFFVNYRGGAMTRAGTAFVGQCKQSGSAAPPRIIKFQFNVNQGYVLEFGDQYMRVQSNGGYVTEPAVSITGATQANPGVITATTLALQNGNLANGDWVFFSGVGGMTQLNNQTYIAASVNLGAKTFALHDLFGNPVDTTAFGAFTTGGTFARLFTLVTPYAAVDLPWLKFTQSADVMTLCCVNQDTGTEYPPYDLSRMTASQWTLTQTTFQASISPPATISGTTQNSGTWTYQYVVTAVDAKTGDESIASPIATITNAVNAGVAANTLTVTWSAVPGAISYNVYRADPALSSIPVGALFYFVGTALGTQFQDSNIVADVTTVPPQHRDPFAENAIDSVQVTAPGSGLDQSTVGYFITTTTGSGAVLQPIVVGGVLVAVNVLEGGQNYRDTDTVTITPNTATAARGSLTFSINPSNGQTIVLNGVTWTFVTTISAPAQTQIGSTLALTLAALAGDLGASSNASLTVASYRASSTVLAITYNTTGTGGNAYTLSAGTTTAVASGATLMGGSGSGGGATATLTLGPDTGTNPGGAAYFQQRRYYFNTLNAPDTYFGSQPGSFLNMDSSIPISDGDAIVGTPWAQQVDGIQAMVPMQSGLVIFTGSGAWQLTGGAQSTAVTPSNQDATPQAYNGISPTVPPITIDYDILYVQEKGSIVRDFAYNFFVNIYTGTDKTELSSHLFTGYQIDAWAYAEEPYKIVWAVRNDGAALSLTYLKPEDIYGWARHDTNGLFVSVASVTEPPVDAVYFIVKRYIQKANNGAGAWVYYAERLNNRIWQYAEDAWCSDCALSYPQNQPSATMTPASATGNANISSCQVIIGGSGYVSPVANAIDPIGKGTGATFNVAHVAGVITAITPITQGSGYSGLTQLVVTDAAGPGVGCIAQPLITNITAFNVSSGVFANVAGQGAAGDVIRVGGGIATVTQFVSSTQVLANITQPITAILQNDPAATPIPQPAGSWSIINPIKTVTGLHHLEGMTVSALADGGAVDPQVVTNGTIQLPAPASQIIVGLPFLPQLQTLYLDAQNQPVTVQGRRKEITALTVRTVASRGIEVGGNQPDASTQPGQVNVPWTNMQPLKEMTPQVSPGQPIPLITGDQYCHPNIEWAVEGQIAIQITDPVPAEVVMLIPEVTVGDNPSP